MPYTLNLFQFWSEDFGSKHIRNICLQLFSKRKTILQIPFTVCTICGLLTLTLSYSVDPQASPCQASWLPLDCSWLELEAGWRGFHTGRATRTGKRGARARTTLVQFSSVLFSSEVLWNGGGISTLASSSERATLEPPHTVKQTCSEVKWKYALISRKQNQDIS